MALPAEPQWACLHLSQWEATGQWHLCGCALANTPTRWYAHAPPWSPIPCPEPSFLQPLNSPPPPWLCPLIILPAAPRPGTCNLQCFNGGSCFLNARRQPKCRCQPRYTGDKCELDQCWEYCRNGGTCAASPSGMAFSSPARTIPGSWTPAPALPYFTSAHPRASCPQPHSLPTASHPVLSPCSRAGRLSGPQSRSHILSHQACPRAGAPRALRAPNAPSRCVRATVPTTAPAPSTRATSPSADASLASWVTAASTVSEPSLGPGGGDDGAGGPENLGWWSQGRVLGREAIHSSARPRLLELGRGVVR